MNLASLVMLTGLISQALIFESEQIFHAQKSRDRTFWPLPDSLGPLMGSWVGNATKLTDLDGLGSISVASLLHLPMFHVKFTH